MGKRKSKRKPAPKMKLVLDTQFDCIYCSHKRSIEIKMDKQTRVGNLVCRVCGVQFQAPINSLSDPIDVYSEWIDAAESKPVPSVSPSRRRVLRPSAPGENARVQFDEEDDFDDEEYDRDLGSAPGGRVISRMRDREEVGEEEEDDVGPLFGE
ncbi:486_t:CDS:2 [Paraglomus brasilianum]|uniref:Transcription elongation factor 1 homolog n=1 Tax=Paraglomus brasilianum TaxID=144538 RepID=A0A9N9F140_9GLOM|nr:486_t:CDS:2 [Paraglomus brasilianum]